VLLLYNCTMRYLADWVPMLVILSAIGWWTLRRRWRAIDRIIPILIVYTCAIGVLLAVTGYTGHFRTMNPQLFDRLSQIRL
jgi:hypothetical protein